METETMQSCARKILERELRDINEDPSTHISFGPLSDDNMFQWQGIIIGPVDTPLEGVLFPLSIHFPIDYPFKPPTVKFLTKGLSSKYRCRWHNSNQHTRRSMEFCTDHREIVTFHLLNSARPNSGRQFISNVESISAQHELLQQESKRIDKKRILRCWSRIKLLCHSNSKARAAKQA
ncbi:unnamed protein product [Camellia sinensis]